MALTEFQRVICRLISAQRVSSGESYVAGATALNVFTQSSRISRDIDLFHDTTEAVEVSWHADRGLLKSNGYLVKVENERPGFVEAEVSKDEGTVVMQWTADSAFRFFPLIEHEDFGLTLHPFDLATNKVLALVGRLEARDWIDVINCHEKIQRLGYLAWAAGGKDPGFSPAAILEQAARSNRYSANEISTLAFAGSPPDAGELSRKWHAMLGEGRELISILPASETGKCVIDKAGNLFSGTVGQLDEAQKHGLVRFHEGRIRGALPLPRHAS
ncbi:MAG TPA: hypothetical protein VF397_00540 [Pyrinomonadaceae bacterium]